MAAADLLSPIAPARVKALVLPVGEIQRDRFASFVDRLNEENVVRLRDISADGRPNRTMFSPLAFPDGAIFYDLIAHVPPPSHLALSPFDLYREPLVIIAVADGEEMKNVVFNRRHSGGGRSTEERNIRDLYQELEELRDTFPKVLVHQALIFDYVPSKDEPIPIPEGILTIPHVKNSKRTTMRTVMCDISSLLLAEMTTLAKSFEAMSFIDSPGHTTTSSRHANGASWGGDDSSGLSRRNSQYATPTMSRSGSVNGVADRSQARMSMPVPPKGLPFGSSSSTPIRPSTPVRSGLSNPPTTFDDIASNAISEPTSPDHASRPGTAEGFRTQSQDRVSIQGFGPGGLNERWRNKGKGRVMIVLGSLYLQAGRWTDALKELIDGATVAKSINDHLWHGKALELIVISLVLLGWTNIEFQVPTICLPPPEKASAAATQTQEIEKADPSQPKWLRYLQLVLPDLLERILGLYSRISAEHLPPLPLSEATIRACKTLSALHIAEGKVGDLFFKVLVEGRYDGKPLTTSPRISITPSRAQIVTMLFRAFPSSSAELLTTVDRVVILSGIASVLGVLGFQRKKVMVVRELVSVLIGGLVEARTRGAAEVGIHPAAGLVATNGLHGQANGAAAALELGEGDIEYGVDAFLGLLLKTYGVVEFDGKPSTPDDSDAAVISRIQMQSKARLFGMQNLKLNILRACINFSEALPDFAGVLKFSSDLLRTAGSGVAPGPRREDASAAITKEEQVRLATNISKTTNLSRRMGFEHLNAEYWDEFLLRGVRLEPPPPSRVPLEHKKSELPGGTTTRASQDVDPFIHNPFLKQPDKISVQQTLVAEEPATFRLTLQNPYDIDVDVESIRLDTEGVEFESSAESTIIGPYRTQLLKISGRPKAAGSLQITGAIVRIRGCRERRFPIFAQPWAPEGEVKIKAIGLPALERQLASLSSALPPLKTERVALNVIAQQPILVVKSTTLPQSSVMVLEGERQVFSVTLQNLSSTTPADLILFSFRDSTQDSVHTALNNRDATPAELYEYELILAKKQALRIRKRKGERRFIAPGESATFDFEILGKPGLTSGTVQVDYAYLGVPPEEILTNFYTRQVSLQLTVTVNASVEVARMDVLPIHGSIPRPLWSRSGHSDDADVTEELASDKYCLLLFDLRNAWPSNMLVELVVDDGAVIEEHILPGNTNRVILPMKRAYLDDPHAPIPALNPSRQRQFVVSTDKISPDTERANREAFWYREKILDSLKGTWKTQSGPSRSGSIELRSMRLTSRMIEAVKVDEVGIDISVEDPKSPSTVGPLAKGGKSNTVCVDDFVQLRVRITNRTQQPIYPTLRLMPALCHRPLNVALDFTRKIAWNGTLQQFLPLLGARSSADVLVGITALCRGEFEITASVEETQLWTPRTEEEKRRSARPRSNTETLMDTVLGARERRIWHSRAPCHLVVRDP